MLLTVDGSVNMQLSAKSVGLFEAFYSPAKPIAMMSHSLDLKAPSKFPEGKTELPFKFEVKPIDADKTLYDTYHGVFIKVEYTVSAEITRSMMSKNSKRTLEFIVEN